MKRNIPKQASIMMLLIAILSAFGLSESFGMAPGHSGGVQDKLGKQDYSELQTIQIPGRMKKVEVTYSPQGGDQIITVTCKVRNRVCLTMEVGSTFNTLTVFDENDSAFGVYQTKSTLLSLSGSEDGEDVTYHSALLQD
jgi:hypothetical protein